MIALMLFALCACGSAAPAKEAPEGMESKLPDSGFSANESKGADTQSAPAAAADDTEESAKIEELKSIAKSLAGKGVEAMHSKLGEPISSESVPTCLGDGTEKVYQYDRLKINTYSEGSEVIINVIVLDKDGNTALDENGEELVYSYK